MSKIPNQVLGFLRISPRELESPRTEPKSSLGLRRAGRSLLLLVCALAAGAQPLLAEEKLSSLEARLRLLEEEVLALKGEIEAMRRMKAPPPVSARPARPPGGEVVVGAGGASLRAPDGSLAIRLRGYFQTDSRAYLGDNPLAGNDTFLLRRLRPVLEISAFRDFEFRLVPDFSGPSATLFDAYFNWRLTPQFQIRAGKIKSPTALERLQSSTALTFVERGLPTHLLPNRDIGVQIHGSLFDRRIDYAAGVFNGTKDGGSTVTDVDDNKDVVVRVFAHPFRQLSNSPFQGLGVGLAATHGRHQGTPRGYATSGQQEFFRFRTGVVNDGTLWRISPQGYYYAGPVGVLWEWARSSQELRLGESRHDLKNRAWQIAGSYLITGEEASYGAIRPRRSLGQDGGGWGALQLVGRVGRLTVDQRAFPVFADPKTQSSQARGLGLGLNWYPNPTVKFTLDFGRTSFGKPISSGDGGSAEKSLFSRVQFAF